MGAILRIVEIRQRRRIVGGPRKRRDTERRQRLLRHHPGRDGGGEILAQERPERLVFPALDIARRPVIEQAEAENVLRRPGDGNGFAEPARHANVEAELELEIEIARRTEARRRLVRAFALPARPPHGRTAGAHRGGAPVIRHGQVFVVGQQRVVRPERAAGIGGVEDRGEEVGEVADPHRQLKFSLRHRDKIPAQALLAMRGAQTPRQRQPQGRPDRRPERHQRIEGGCGARARGIGRDAGERGSGCGDVEDRVTDRHADARGRPGHRAEHAERQVLDREIAVRGVRAFEEASARRIVRLVQRDCHLTNLGKIAPCAATTAAVYDAPPCSCSSRRR